ncbi:patatin-like phospholipase family protein [Knoellia sp. CPCC 206435]|uniref:patatin-like phospholipase family protein n=1 Tax=Knoellia terrae TaxID=3404797 RepID=UPI003B42806C
MPATPRSAPAPPGRTAFVLTGGGSLGAVQAGMVSALHDHGIDPDLLVGTSVGAVNAAHLAGPGALSDRIGELRELWRGMRRSDVFVASPRRWVRAATGSAPSLFSDGPLLHLLTTHLGYSSFEDAQRQLALTATDLVTGAALTLDHGSVVDAVLASAAVPGLLPSVQRDGRTLVDGAVGHPGPLAYADEHGVADIYLLPAGYPCAGAPPRGALAVGLTALALLLHHQLVDEVERYAGNARLHVVPPLCPLAVSPADFGHAGEVLERAHETTSVWLEHEDATGRHTGAGVLGFHGPHDTPTSHASSPRRQPIEGILR